MSVYQGITRSSDNTVYRDSLDEFFKEFIEYHKWKSKTTNFSKDIFPFKEWKKSVPGLN
jgi:hypothetical protein